MQIVLITSQRYNHWMYHIVRARPWWFYSWVMLLNSVEFSFKAQKKHNQHHFMLRSSLQTAGVSLPAPHIVHRVWSLPGSILQCLELPVAQTTFSLVGWVKQLKFLPERRLQCCPLYASWESFLGPLSVCLSVSCTSSSYSLAKLAFACGWLLGTANPCLWLLSHWFGVEKLL